MLLSWTTTTTTTSKGRIEEEEEERGVQGISFSTFLSIQSLFVPGAVTISAAPRSAQQRMEGETATAATTTTTTSRSTQRSEKGAHGS